MIPYSRQNISQDDIDAVVNVLQSDYLTQGDTVPRFEEALAKYCGSQHAVAVCNATAALHTACLALGLSNKSLAWVAANSFVASANCVRFCGAEVDFVDVDQDTGLISLEALEQKFNSAKRSGIFPRVLIVVHIGGQSCAMKPISDLCRRFGVALIEDASHALGAKYRGSPVGSCKYSDCAVFSFHPVKPITCGEGGAVVSNDEEIAIKIRLLSHHGIQRYSDKQTDKNELSVRVEQVELGYNYRLSDIHAALGLSQLHALNKRVEAREQQAQRYDQLLNSTVVKAVNISEDCQSSRHLYPVLFSSKASRNAAFNLLRSKNYGVNIHYSSIPSQPYYRNLGFRSENYPGARAWAEHELSLPLHEQVDIQKQKEVVSLCEKSCLEKNLEQVG